MQSRDRGVSAIIGELESLQTTLDERRKKVETQLDDQLIDYNHSREHKNITEAMRAVTQASAAIKKDGSYENVATNLKTLGTNTYIKSDMATAMAGVREGYNPQVTFAMMSLNEHLQTLAPQASAASHATATQPQATSDLAARRANRRANLNFSETTAEKASSSTPEAPQVRTDAAAASPQATPASFTAEKQKTQKASKEKSKHSKSESHKHSVKHGHK